MKENKSSTSTKVIAIILIGLLAFSVVAGALAMFLG